MVMTSLLMALIAPRTLNRCRPLGALIQTRVTHHNVERKAPKTKCAASTKNTARLPFFASASRGTSVFFKRCLLDRIGFSRQHPGLEAPHSTMLLQEPADLGRRAAYASEF